MTGALTGFVNEPCHRKYPVPIMIPRPLSTDGPRLDRAPIPPPTAATEPHEELLRIIREACPQSLAVSGWRWANLHKEEAIAPPPGLERRAPPKEETQEQGCVHDRWPSETATSPNRQATYLRIGGCAPSLQRFDTGMTATPSCHRRDNNRDFR